MGTHLYLSHCCWGDEGKELWSRLVLFGGWCVCNAMLDSLSLPPLTNDDDISLLIAMFVSLSPTHLKNDVDSSLLVLPGVLCTEALIISLTYLRRWNGRIGGLGSDALVFW
jgi:hypothetical protein